MIKHRPLIRKVKDYIFSSLAFPLSFDVAVMFWSLFFFNRETVAPKVWDEIFPVWLNHFIHTDIVLFISIELIVLHRNYPKKKPSLIGLLFLMFCYICWVHIINLKTDQWVYPILANFNWAERIGFHLFNVSIPVAFYFLGKFINSLIWNKTRVAKIIQRISEQK
jgi:FAR-17a/AIG1-like protein